MATQSSESISPGQPKAGSCRGASTTRMGTRKAPSAPPGRVACRRQSAQTLERRATTLMQRRLAVMPEELHEALVAYKVHVYRGLAERARNEARWARRGIALVDALEAASPEELSEHGAGVHLPGRFTARELSREAAATGDGAAGRRSPPRWHGPGY